MLKKKHNLQKQLVLKYNYKLQFLDKLLNDSLRINHYIPAIDRLSYFAQEKNCDYMHFKFATFQKLTCLISLSPKVPNKSYAYARFFLNKQFDKLTISNTLK